MWLQWDPVNISRMTLASAVLVRMEARENHSPVSVDAVYLTQICACGQSMEASGSKDASRYFDLGFGESITLD